MDRYLAIDSGKNATKVAIYDPEKNSTKKLAFLTKIGDGDFSDDSIESGQYDKISEFGIRPPELIHVSDMVKYYFRWFHISDKNTSPADVRSNLHHSYRYCRWFDGFCRRIHIRKSAMPELANYVQENLISLQSIPNELRNEQTATAISCNNNLCNMLRIFMAKDEDLTPTDLQYKRDMMDEFIFDDNDAILPTVVLS